MPTFSAGEVMRWCLICHRPLSFYHVGNVCQLCYHANAKPEDDAGLTDAEFDCGDCLADIGECAIGCECKCHKKVK